MKKVILILSALVFLSCAEVDQDYVFDEGAYNEYNETETNEMIKYSDWADVDGNSDTWTATAKNDSALGAKDGTGWRKEIPNDWWGFAQAVLLAVNVVPNDTVETAAASQILDGLRALDVPLTRISDGDLNISNTNTVPNKVNTTVLQTDNVGQPHTLSIQQSDGVAGTALSNTMVPAYSENYEFAPAGYVSQTRRAQGTVYEGTRHPTQGTPLFNKSILNLTGESVVFTEVLDSGGDEVPAWITTTRIDTNIPTGVDILGVSGRWHNQDGHLNIGGISLHNFLDSGGKQTAYLKVTAESSISSSPKIASEFKLNIEFDGTNL